MRNHPRQTKLTMLAGLLALSGLTGLAHWAFRNHAPDSAGVTVNALQPRHHTTGAVAAVPVQSGGPYRVAQSVIASGGGGSAGGNLTLTGSIGESVSASSSNGPYAISGGFFSGSAGNGATCTTITVAPANATLPSGVAGTSYTQTFTQSGGTGAISWSLSAGSLPANMTLNASTGVLAGAPTTFGTFNFTVQATDSMSCQGTQSYSLMIIGCTFAINPNTQSFSANAATGSAQVTTSAGCVWTSVSNASWLMITAGTSGNGNGTVGYSVAQNTTTNQRVGTLTIAGLTLTVTQAAANPQPPPTLASVSAASYKGEALTPDSIVAAFGVQMATDVQVATTIPLPTNLAGTTVRVIDSQNIERLAPLFFVSPNQINYLMPSEVALGQARVIATSGDGHVSIGVAQIASVAPGVFTANATGAGLAAAVALRIKPDGQVFYEPMAQFDQATQQMIAVPIDLTVTGDQVYLVLYGTGIRGRSALSAVTAQIGSNNVSVEYAGRSGLAGLDQLNLPLPNGYAGSGELTVALTVDGQTANVVKVTFK